MSEKAMTTIEGNKLIVEFEGYEYSGGWFRHTDASHPCYRLDPNNLKYNCSWDWLMPVIEKISRIPHPEPEVEGFRMDTFYPVTFGMISPAGKPMFRFFCSSLFEENTLIEAAWLAVVDFIKWYNTQNPQQ